MPPRFMSVKECVDQLLEVEETLNAGTINLETKCFGVARVGAESQLIVSGQMGEFSSKGDIEMGEPLHSFVICASELHHLEEEFYNQFRAVKIK